VYANDLTVKAILELKKYNFFKKIEFHIIGDGALFEEETQDLQNLENVILEKRFLMRSEIAELHKEYGVFLCPSRMDTHGVSRDEAMSSGLVPITSNAGAISEFVDEETGYLANFEDHEGLARAIHHLWENPHIFAAKSRASAKAVRETREKGKIIDLEISLFK
jgi:glycosyltransferase involved in cell wall biosynthesis